MTRRTRLDQPRLLALIEQTYAAAEDSRLWSSVLVSLADAVAATGATLISHDLASSGNAAHPVRMDPDAIRLYQEYYHQVDAWAHAAGRRKLVVAGRVLTDAAIVTRSEFEKTEYYPFVTRYAVTRLLQATLEVRARGICGVSLYRSDADREFGSDEVRFLEAVVPHLRRALRMSDLFARATSERELALDGLDAARQAVMFVNREGGVAYANRAANDILARSDGLSLDKTRLTASSASMTLALRRLCAECADTTVGEGLSAGAAIVLPRPSGRLALQVLICPVRRRDVLGFRDDRIGAIVFVSDPEEVTRPSERLLQTFYGLTRTEAHLASWLAAGRSIDEIADACNYTKATVQWYSKQILSKTGCRTRSMLVRQVATTLSSLALDDTKNRA